MSSLRGHCHHCSHTWVLTGSGSGSVADTRPPVIPSVSSRVLQVLRAGADPCPAP